jgi:imidazolonepropionase-like amidohydrolase
MISLRNARLLAGPELDERSVREIVVDGATIIELRDGGVPRPDAIDLDGAFVVPGLSDAHVHFDLDGSMRPYVQWAQPPFGRARTCVVNGLRSLAGGIVGVRDLGSTDYMVLDVARAVAERRMLGPHIRAAGRFIAMTGGHMYEYGREADGVDDVVRAVREQVRAGAGMIKLMATGGLSSPGNPQATELSQAELSAGVSEAHRAGLPVAAHAHSPGGVISAITAGVDTVEHGAFLDDEAIASLLGSGTPLVPTITALKNITAGSGVDADVLAKSLAALPRFEASIRAAIRAGVRIAAGTDGGTALNPIGDLVDELEAYCRLGASPYGALLAGTVHSGELVGGGLGQADVGRPAALLVLDQDPRTNVAALRELSSVVIGERILPMAKLRRRLDDFGESIAPRRMAEATGGIGT